MHVDPEGREMRVPRVLRWQVRDYGRTIVEFEAEIDSEWRYGHGKGYVGAYTYREVSTVRRSTAPVTSNGWTAKSEAPSVYRCLSSTLPS
ncbi:hypothetical protein GCM10020255_018680 [Rhodococcus baikonurensis]